MEIYLPIAELSVNVPLLLAIGAAVGVVAGLFGVGGGFLATPLLILVGIPPSVAIATVSAQIAASSASGVPGHAERKTIDWSLAAALVVSGTVGSALGVAALRALESRGLADTVVAVAFLLLLGGIGSSMSIESLHAKLRGKPRAQANSGPAARPYQPRVLSVRTPGEVLLRYSSPFCRSLQYAIQHRPGAFPCWRKALRSEPGNLVGFDLTLRLRHWRC